MPVLKFVYTHIFFVVAYAVHPEAHGHAYENGTRSDQADADVPDGWHGLRVMVGQPEPVEQRTNAHERHAESVRPLRFFRHDQRHNPGWFLQMAVVTGFWSSRLARSDPSIHDYCLYVYCLCAVVLTAAALGF